MPSGSSRSAKETASSSLPVTYQVEVSGPTGVALGDLRKNGLNDVVAGRIDATSVPLNKGKGKFSDGCGFPCRALTVAAPRRISMATGNRTWRYPPQPA
jgi:hypothetical protein